MGTRHLQTVITKEGETKIRQYGQWDGYPSGQGIDILKYLRSGDLDKYHENLCKIPLITKKQGKTVDRDPQWAINYPYLSRDCGARIHKMIEDGIVKFVDFISVLEAHKWCEGFYTIDFQKGVFTSEYGGIVKSFPPSKLPSNDEYLKAMQSGE